MRDVIAALAPAWVVMALIFGPAAAVLAARRARNPVLWLAFGAIIGPIALGLLLIAPPGRCVACGEPTSGFGSSCPFCGLNARTGRPSSPRGTVVGPALPGPESGAFPATGPAILPQPFAPTSRDTGVGVPVMAPQTASNLDRLSFQRGGSVAASLPTSARDAELTILAIGVFATGTETLSVGSRYLIARSHDHLMIRGPVEPSPNYVELDLPLDRLEANLAEDRLVLSGYKSKRRRFILGFAAVAQLSTTPLERAFDPTAPVGVAAAR